jgi:hypothetical protein
MSWPDLRWPDDLSKDAISVPIDRIDTTLLTRFRPNDWKSVGKGLIATQRIYG